MAKKKSKTPINVQNKQVEPFIYQATLVKVVDGDTIDVTLDLGFNVLLHNQRVRLAGIDTPESRTRNLEEKKLGLAAKARNKELLESVSSKSGFFRIKSYGTGKYGRVLGEIFIQDADGKQYSINETLINEGHAYVYEGGTKKVFKG